MWQSGDTFQHVWGATDMFGQACCAPYSTQYTVHRCPVCDVYEYHTSLCLLFYVHVVCYAYSTQLYYLRCTIRLFCSISAWILLANMFTVHRCTVCAILQKSLCFHPCVHIYEYVVGHVYSIHRCRWCTIL